VAIAHWPRIPNFVFTESAMLPGPWLSDSYWNDEWLTPAERADRGVGAVPLPRPAPWPRQLPMPLPGAVNALPVPGSSVFEFRDRPRLAARTVAALSSRRGEPTVSSEHAKHGAAAEARASRRSGKGKPQLGRIGSANAAQPGRRALKRLVQVKKRSV
jgi:peptidoglycan-N-acetylglucosamine deacetylase